MIIGTAGHIDHGKTALVKALTGVDADRLAEEKARGITIDLGFAYADLGDGNVTGFVDVPGHERLIRTMLAGAGGIDMALLVIAADDGVMPQTREHLALLELLGITRAIVALSKADLADAELRAARSREIADCLAETALAAAPILAVSAQSGEGIEALRAALIAASARTRTRAADGPMRLSVDRSFTIAGAGTVVTGMMLSGQVAIGDEVMISPLGLPARVRGIHAQNHRAEIGRAGQRCALNLSGEGVSRDAIARGDMILAPWLHAPAERIDAELRVLAGEPRPITTWMPVHLHSHGVDVPARVVPLAGDIAPGQSGLVQLVLSRAIAARIGDRFVLRDASASRSIGGGRFLDLRAPARKRGTPERLALLAAAGEADHAQALARQLQVQPVALSPWLRDRGLLAALGPGILQAAGAELIEGLALSEAHLLALREGMQTTLAAFHAENPDLAGLGRERLRLQLLPRLPKEVFVALLRAEAEAGRIALDGAFLRLPGHEVRLSPEDQAMLDAVLPQLLGEARYRPPRVRDFSKAMGFDERELRRVMRMAQKAGRIDQVANDHFFDRQVVREMVTILVDLDRLSPDGWFTAALFRDRVNNGRKVAIEILDFFDRLGITLRRGDLRRLNPHRLDLFGALPPLPEDARAPETKAEPATDLAASEARP